MKKIFTILGVGLLAAMSGQAQGQQTFDGIDHVSITKDINLDTCKVYIVPTVLAEKKGKKKAEEQDIAFAELGKTIAKELKATYRHGTFEVIDNVKNVPAGAVVVEACLKEIEWGSGFARQMTMGAGGRMAGTYSVKMSDAKGQILEYDTRRTHSTSMTSAMGPDIIRLYNRAVALDLLTILTRNEKSKIQNIKGIDYVVVSQKVNLENRKVCIAPVNMSDLKPGKDAAEQQEAFNELGETLMEALKKGFKNTTFELIADAKNAPADALVLEAIMKDVDFGVATSKDKLLGASDRMSGSYQVNLSNSQGKLVEFKNRRFHNMSMKSSKASAVIRVYNEALADDVVTVLKNIK